MKVEIEESKLQTAYANACDGVKDFMESLFGKKVFEAAKCIDEVLDGIRAIAPDIAILEI